MTLDIEQRFISALLRAPKNQQEAFFDKAFPLSLFKQRPGEVKWIQDFRDKHGVYPSPAAFTSRFKWRTKKIKDSWNAALDVIVEQQHYREIKRVVEQSREMIDKGTGMTKVISYFQNEAQKFTTFDVDTDDVDLAKSKGTLRRYLKFAKQKKQKSHTLFTTPWPTINKVIHQLLPEDLAVIQGRLGMGKTYFMCAWALFLAEMGVRVLFVSKEMSTERIEDRLELMRFKINPDRFREGSLSPKELADYRRKKLKAKPVSLVISGKEEVTGTGFAPIVAAIRKYKPQVVFIDAAYRIVMEGESKQLKDHERFGRIAVNSKRIAKAMKVMVAISIQMNRGAEDKKGNTKGGVINAFGSDAWLQEADLGIAINGTRNVGDQRELEILKSRESGAGSVLTSFKFDPYIQLVELAKSQLVSTQPSQKFHGI